MSSLRPGRDTHTHTHTHTHTLSLSRHTHTHTHTHTQTVNERENWKSIMSSLLCDLNNLTNSLKLCLVLRSFTEAVKFVQRSSGLSSEEQETLPVWHLENCPNPQCLHQPSNICYENPDLWCFCVLSSDPACFLQHSNRVQALTWTQSIRVKSLPLKDICAQS